MKDFFNKVASAFSADAATTALTIIFFFVLFFYLINLLQRNNARWMIAVMIAYVAITGVIFMLARSAQRGEKLLFWGLGMVLGGAVGNLVDRIRFRAVVDFLDFYVGQWHWPAFNVADIAICCGALLVCLSMWLKGPSGRAS